MTEEGYLRFISISDGWMYPGVNPSQDKALRSILGEFSDERIQLCAAEVVASGATKFDFKQIQKLLKSRPNHATECKFWWTLDGCFGGDVEAISPAEKIRITGYILEEFGRHPNRIPKPTELLEALGSPITLEEAS